MVLDVLVHGEKNQETIDKSMYNHVLLVDIDGPMTGIPSIITTCFMKGLVSSPSFFINQPMGIWDIRWSSHMNEYRYN